MLLLTGTVLLALWGCAVSDPAKDFYEERTLYDLPWNRQAGDMAVPDDPFASKSEQTLTGTGGRGVPYKRCAAAPVSQDDIVGINVCEGEKYTKGCMSTRTPPFFECTCTSGYQCSFCNITATPCTPKSQYCDADHTAKCAPSPNECQMPMCQCKPGWKTDYAKVMSGKGVQCDEDINECLYSPGPCKNGGKCVNTPGSYKCDCASGFGGKDCAYDAGCNDIHVPCAEAAVCQMETWEGVPYGQCKCKPGYNGDPYIQCGKTSVGTTEVYGDPHFKTFDSSAYKNYMGTCPVTLARPCQHIPHVPDFKVVLRASPACNPTKRVTCIEYTFFEAYGHRVTIPSVATVPTKIFVDGVEQKLPYDELAPALRVSAGNPGSGVIYSISTNFSVSASVQAYGTYATVLVHVPRSHALSGKMCGLGGTMDGNAGDDMKKPDGTITSDLNDWGDSWAAENIGDYDSYGCVFGKAITIDSMALRKNETWAGSETECRFLTDNTGPFKECFGILDPAVTAGAYGNCIYDVGTSRGQSQGKISNLACESHLKPYAEKCRNALLAKGVNKWYWREGVCPDPNCPPNAHFNPYASVCISTCKHPDASRECYTTQTQEACVCDVTDTTLYVFDNGKCVQLDQCPGDADGVTVLTEQQMVDLLCSKNCLFLDPSNADSGLFCKPIQCQAHSSCAVTPDRKRDCVCDKGYVGDGRHSCRVPQRNCADLLKYHGVKASGVSAIGIWSYLNITRKAFCDMETVNGGWTVIQRRVDETDFNRTWAEYVKGFGDLSGSFWYGLEMLHVLTMYNNSMNLRIEFDDCDGKKTYQMYDNFKVGDSSTNYKMTYTATSGTAGDAFASTSPSYVEPNGMQFSTFDKDHDAFEGINCALLYDSGWWHRACTASNVNGKYYDKCGGKGQINAATWFSGHVPGPVHCMKRIEMKVRPNVYPPTD